MFVILDASIVHGGGSSYVGSLAAGLDLYASDNTRAAFAEARVSRTRTIGDEPDRRRRSIEMTKALMDAMNVEFEYQVRRSLRDWLVAAPVRPPAPVEQQALPPPSSDD